ncbi:MAG: DUF6443 domain-containing protein [Sphingobacterium sp.]|jgi:RHS repeat-associated protein|nr:DUF6443 domain-containing protein [Sphingobacterium sp.]
MKNFLKYILVIAGTGAFTSIAQAQGSNNVPTTDSLIITTPVDYPGLINMTSTLKKNVLTTVIPDQPVQSLPAGAYKFRQRKDYIDGLGRPLQSVERNAGPDSFDIIKAYVYDSLGREQYQYQPFAVRVSSITSSGNIRMDVNSKMRSFYDGAAPNEQPYGRTDFEPSSLGRPLKQLAPGKNWVGTNRGQSFQYLHNVTDEVMKWYIGRELHAVPYVDGTYGAGELNVSVVIDEDGNKTKEFTDKNGRLILKKTFEFANPPDYAHTGYSCTYYVYDDQGRLRYVIPPAGVWYMPVGWDVNGVKSYCYSYDYDHRGRLIEKKIPGKDPEEFFYDKRDRLVMSRDGNLREQNKMLFTIYDPIDRPIVTGIVDAPYDREGVVALLENSDTYNPPDFLYYIKNYDLYNVYPPENLAGCEMLTYTYYDNYDQITGFSYDPDQFPNETSVTPEFDPPVLSTVTRGLVTGNKVRIQDPEDPAGNQWIKTVNYYDNKGRLLQTQSRNRLKGLDISSNLYYFQGMLWKNILRHQNPDAQQIPGAIDSAITTFKLVKTSTRNIREYGGSDQVVKLQQKINGGPLYNIGQYHYDHLSRTVLKDYSGSMVLNEYNMRGFINHISVKDQNGSQTTPLFDERIRYDWGFKGKRYNGNIAGIIWAYSEGKPQAYGYSYDNLDRLTYAEYRNYSAPAGGGLPSWIKTNQDYSVSNISYDQNGNLLSMNQKAGKEKNLNVVRNMDLLTYTYEPNSNRLKTVEDGGDVIDGLPDFRNGASAATEYFYDKNGNMTQDDNKHLQVAYNYLNKPVTNSITGKGIIYYTYDATGNLLKKVLDSGGKRTVYDYFGNFVYKDNVLQFILNEEGRTRPVANDTTAGYTRFVYDYFIKDHLGNVRSTVTAEPINSNYLARHEIATASVEQLVFDNIPNVRDAKPGSINPNDGMAAHLDANNPDTRVGTAIMLKVMPGDKFTITASSHYDGEYHGGEETGAQGVIASLTNALMGGGTYAGVPVSELPENIRTVQNILGNPALPEQLATLQSSDLSIAPKAHLNYLFFDDKFQLQSNLSGAVQVTPAGNNGWEILNPGNICNCTFGPSGGTGGAGGYILVYIDNQSVGKSVWFDDVHIEHFTSKVLEETHYYPHGLTLGVGKSGQNNLPNQPLKYQGIELERHFGLEMYETFYRGLDPQIGRFMQIDPKANEDYSISPYASMRNNPVTNIDPLGDVTKYFNENGSMIWQTNEKEGNYANIVSSENAGAFGKAIGSYFEQVANGSTMSQEDLSKSLSSLGTSYDLNSFENFYNENASKFPAKSIDGESLEGASNFYVDDKPTRKLFAEAGANIVMKDGNATAGEKVGSSAKYNGVFKDDIPKEDNSTGRVIHLHQGAKVQYYKDGFNNTARPNAGDGGGPSHKGDYRTYDKYNPSKVRDVMVNKTDIYLFNNNDKQTIKIPRK